MTVKIRVFKDEDFWQVENLVRQFMNNDPFSPPIIVRQMQALFGQFFLVASDSSSPREEILGYVMGGIEYSNKNLGWVLEIFVKESSRNRNIGHNLIHELTLKFKEAGVSEIRLTVDPLNAAGLKIYHKNGFRQIDCLTEHYRKGKKVYLMKSLPRSTMRIGLICGGPSDERGISLNSARSVMDHLTPFGWEILPIYCNRKCNFYVLDRSQLYSNTPSDFDFKLASKIPLTEEEFVAVLRDTDIVLPAIHGKFGEDGTLQALLEKYKIPYVGSSSESCQMMFDKETAVNHMKRLGYPTLQNCVINNNDSVELRWKKTAAFLASPSQKKIIVKPTDGGSSIGVNAADTLESAVTHINQIFINKYGSKAMIEPYCQGREFTIIVIQDKKDKPVALIPTEIELADRDKVFTYRDKYLLSDLVKYHCPPRFKDSEIKKIQRFAENLFKDFQMRDFSRIDGWLLDDGSLLFSDINPISGMEQNSFFFIQGCRIGLTHGDFLYTIISHAAERYGIDCPICPVKKKPDAKKIRVLFGGKTAERQVSLSSGANVWLKLLYSADYLPTPYLLTPENDVWQLPYSYTLHHNIEEIQAHCAETSDIISKLKELAPQLRQRLGLSPLFDDEYESPRRMSFDQFCKEAKDENAFIFNALHGGEGEDGQIQRKLNKYGLPYNGSDAETSQLCMDKYETGKIINGLNDSELISLKKELIPAKPKESPQIIWDNIVEKIGTDNLIVKPRGDGCSAGVVPLTSAMELDTYLDAIKKGLPRLEAKTLKKQEQSIDLPVHVDWFIFEPFIEIDKIRIRGHNLEYKPKTGWIELTVGVLEEHGKYHALTPSIAIAEGNVLSVEEKFQGGTGINLTPPPENLITSEQISLIKRKIEKAAGALGIEGYARIDIFFNTKTEVTVVIEANSLPGLTPSTVIYHQALAEPISLYPQAFLSKIVELGLNRRKLAFL